MEKYCPRCAYEGHKARILENALLSRCERCMFDFKFTVKEGKVRPPLKGLNAILGVLR